MQCLMVCKGFFDDIDIMFDHININLMLEVDSNRYDQFIIVKRDYDAESLCNDCYLCFFLHQKTTDITGSNVNM